MKTLVVTALILFLTACSDRVVESDGFEFGEEGHLVGYKKYGDERVECTSPPEVVEAFYEIKCS